MGKPWPVTQQFQLCRGPLSEPGLLMSHSLPLAPGKGDEGLPAAMAFWEMEVRSARWCSGTGILTLSTTRALVIPGSS